MAIIFGRYEFVNKLKIIIMSLCGNVILYDFGEIGTEFES